MWGNPLTLKIEGDNGENWACREKNSEKGLPLIFSVMKTDFAVIMKQKGIIQ